MSIWADQLIEEYTDGKRQLKQLRDHLDREDSTDRENMKFAVKWIGTGKQPGIFRGIDRRAIYQRQSLEFMDLIPDIASQLDINDHELYMSDDQKETLLIYLHHSHIEKGNAIFFIRRRE